MLPSPVGASSPHHKIHPCKPCAITVSVVNTITIIGIIFILAQGHYGPSSTPFSRHCFEVLGSSGCYSLLATSIIIYGILAYYYCRTKAPPSPQSPQQPTSPPPVRKPPQQQHPQRVSPQHTNLEVVPGLFSHTYPPIEFYDQNDPGTGVFSNYFPEWVSLNGWQLSTREHVFQYLKALCITRGADPTYLSSLLQTFQKTSADGILGMLNHYFPQLQGQLKTNGWFSAIQAPPPLNQKIFAYQAFFTSYFQALKKHNGWIADHQGHPIPDWDLPHKVFAIQKQDLAMLYTLVKGGAIYQQRIASSGDSLITERTSRARSRKDYIWGDGPSGKGQNRLGLAHMIHRLVAQGVLPSLSDDELIQLICS